MFTPSVPIDMSLRLFCTNQEIALINKQNSIIKCKIIDKTRLKLTIKNTVNVTLKFENDKTRQEKSTKNT